MSDGQFGAANGFLRLVEPFGLLPSQPEQSSLFDWQGVETGAQVRRSRTVSKSDTPESLALHWGRKRRTAIPLPSSHGHAAIPSFA